jgi:hypothetical protein
MLQKPNSLLAIVAFIAADFSGFSGPPGSKNERISEKSPDATKIISVGS